MIGKTIIGLNNTKWSLIRNRNLLYLVGLNYWSIVGGKSDNTYQNLKIY